MFKTLLSTMKWVRGEVSRGMGGGGGLGIWDKSKSKIYKKLVRPAMM